MRLRGSSPVDGGALLSVKRGEWVLVEDVTGYEGRVVVVIGVTAVIRVTGEDGGGDTYRAAELRCCRPGLDAMSVDTPYRSAKATTRTPEQASSARRPCAQSRGPCRIGLGPGPPTHPFRRRWAAQQRTSIGAERLVVGAWMRATTLGSNSSPAAAARIRSRLPAASTRSSRSIGSRPGARRAASLITWTLRVPGSPKRVPVVRGQ
jgi:hypothetical protein